MSSIAEWRWPTASKSRNIFGKTPEMAYFKDC
jgi:hypothetical protein